MDLKNVKSLDKLLVFQCKSCSENQWNILGASFHFKPRTLSGATGLSLEVIRKLPEEKGQVYMRSL